MSDSSANRTTVRKVTLQLGLAQTLAWASSYYLPAVLASGMAREIGVSTNVVFGAFSLSLAVAAVTGPFSGRLIDRHGGRPVLLGSSLIFASALTLLANAQGLLMLFAAWTILGVGMGCGLYDAAFSTLVRLYGAAARTPITGVTLMAGFASTVGWPASAWLESRYGWRGTCLAWAVAHVLMGALVYSRIPRPAPSVPHSPHATAGSSPVPAPRRLTAALLAFVFAATWFVSTALAAHLPRLLVDTGTTYAAAVAFGALVGPAQVAGRVFEFSFLRRFHPLLAARGAALAHPLGAALLGVFGGTVAPVFTILHGLGNGILTIANGALPLALFGSAGYGARQGWLMLPARFVQALAPLLFGLTLDALHAAAVWITGSVALLAFVALLVLRG